jgi:hypothetical protein
MFEKTDNAFEQIMLQSSFENSNYRGVLLLTVTRLHLDRVQVHIIPRRSSNKAISATASSV